MVICGFVIRKNYILQTFIKHFQATIIFLDKPCKLYVDKFYEILSSLFFLWNVKAIHFEKKIKRQQNNKKFFDKNTYQMFNIQLDKTQKFWRLMRHQSLSRCVFLKDHTLYNIIGSPKSFWKYRTSIDVIKILNMGLHTHRLMGISPTGPNRIFLYTRLLVNTADECLPYDRPVKFKN